MKRVSITLSFIFCMNFIAFSQIINESIPKFAESLFDLERAAIEENLTKRGFSLLPAETLHQFGYDAENIVAGYGNYKIWCIVVFDYLDYVEKVLVNNVTYTRAYGMMYEYQNAGYVLDEKNSTNVELVYVKQEGDFVYAAFVNFLVTPYNCITKTEFRKELKR